MKFKQFKLKFILKNVFVSKMSLKFSDLMEKDKNFYATGVHIDWYFYLLDNNEPKLYEQSGLYNIISQSNYNINKIKNPKTKLSKYYNPYKTLRFTNNENGSIFTLCVNRITSIDIGGENIHIEFKIHPSITKYAFDYKLPLISGSADISAPENIINDLYYQIYNNLIIKNNGFRPKCEYCEGFKGINGKIKLEQPYNKKYMVCFDCINVANQFFNALLEEISQIKDWQEILDRRSELIQLSNSGKMFALENDDDKLQNFYDALIVQINYLAAAIDYEGASKLLIRIQRYAEKKGYRSLEEYTKLLRQSFSTIDPEESIENYIAPEIPEVADDILEEEEEIEQEEVEAEAMAQEPSEEIEQEEVEAEAMAQERDRTRGS